MADESIRDQVQWAASRLSMQGEGDDAWHRLVEMGPDALPHVLEEFDKTVLRDQLSSHEPRIWKAALDALVTLGGPPLSKH